MYAAPGLRTFPKPVPETTILNDLRQLPPIEAAAQSRVSCLIRVHVSKPEIEQTFGAFVFIFCRSRGNARQDVRARRTRRPTLAPARADRADRTRPMK